MFDTLTILGLFAFFGIVLLMNKDNDEEIVKSKEQSESKDKIKKCKKKRKSKEKEQNERCSKLLKMIIVQGLIDLKNKDKREKAKKWIDMKNKEFLSICSFIDINPQKIFNVKNKICSNLAN